MHALSSVSHAADAVTTCGADGPLHFPGQAQCGEAWQRVLLDMPASLILSDETLAMYLVIRGVQIHMIRDTGIRIYFEQFQAGPEHHHAITRQILEELEGADMWHQLAFFRLMLDGDHREDFFEMAHTLILHRMREDPRPFHLLVRESEYSLAWYAALASDGTRLLSTASDVASEVAPTEQDVDSDLSHDSFDSFLSDSELPLPQAERDGCPVPQPLRSAAEPQGLSTLSGADKDRVLAANKLYRAVGRVVDLALQLGIFATVENPLNSLAWLCDGLDHLCRREDAYQLIFDACMHGGDRDKTTLFWCSDARFQSLALRCSRDHKHASWKPRFSDGHWQFPTAQEAALTQLWLLLHSNQGPASKSHCSDSQSTLDRWFPATYDCWAVPVRSTDAAAPLLKCYPKGARVTQRKLVPWGAVRVCAVSTYAGFDRQSSAELLGEAARISQPDSSDFSLIAGEDENEVYKVVGMVCDDNPCATQAEILTIGVPREPEDFVKAAVRAGHPRNAILVNRQGPAKEIAANVVMPAEERRRRADKARDAWKKIAKESASPNDALMKQKPTYLAKALAGKNVIAWRRILERNGFPDKMLWADLRDGFRLTGWMRETGIFKPRVKAPESSLESLLTQSSYRSPMTMSRITNTKPDDTSQKAWAETQEEARKGWIFEDTDPDFDNIVLAHRFGLEQKKQGEGD
ncbi:unnamed protein product [Symbiodinium sp. CCMP2592]|nr:unnamed protein product [Symbiodinium sp. CCMP2592]